MNCPICTEPNASDARFCAYCAAPLNVAAADAAPAPAMREPAAGMIERVTNILLRPRAEWPRIAQESTSVVQLFVGYVIPLAGFAALISLIRLTVIGVGLPFAGTLRMPVMAGLRSAVFSFVMALIGVYVLALIVNALAPTFSGTRDQRQALKVTAYAMTPVWVGAVFGLLPYLGALLGLVAGIYGIYLLYLGLPGLMRAPREKAAAYTALVVVCAILLGLAIGALSAEFGGVRLRGTP